MREIIIDTETTGLDFKKGDRVVEVGCVELFNHVSTGKNLQFYCSTDRIISEDARKITGLSNSFLNKFPTFSKQAESFLDFIKDDTLIIHNADFDIGFLNNELKLAGLKKIENRVVDTVALARKTLNTRIANLDSLCKRFSIDLTQRKLHGALLDCQLLAEVYLELLGGKQTSLELKHKHGGENKKKTTENITKKIHVIDLEKAEIQKHKDFVADLKNALWHKVEY